MKIESILINGFNIKVVSLNTVIVGTGVAGLNAADTLYNLGETDIAIVTEGLNMGTSRNTGSDKQTYYKLNTSGSIKDSVRDVAKTLYGGGSMNGDIALIEAANSTQAFYKLVNIGVPFPHNKYGEHVGYKTDHDPAQRGISAGPLTSKYMTERLQEQVENKKIRIFDGYFVLGIITDKEKQKSLGIITLDISSCINNEPNLVVFNSTNVIYATGGPAANYRYSVYPESQHGAIGVAFESGVKCQNLTEIQSGIASVKFRWNLSGSYQQVLPRYISIDSDGNEVEFLEDYFENKKNLLNSIFLKGYQWPFDYMKTIGNGSSMIDIFVYIESFIKGRKVYLDYTRNPKCLLDKEGKPDFSLLSKECYEYLDNSDALLSTPIERLKKLNNPAIELYQNNGIDLYNEYLEIQICTQHLNGGIKGNIWWESNIRNFFSVGETSGTFGVYRPGGTALNSCQVGSMRAATYIKQKYNQNPLNIDEFLQIAEIDIKEKINIIKELIDSKENKSNIIEKRLYYQNFMSKYASFIRNIKECKKYVDYLKSELNNFTSNTKIASSLEIYYALQNREILLSQLVMISSIVEYYEKGGGSRGSYIIIDDHEADLFTYLLDLRNKDIITDSFKGLICESYLNAEGTYQVCHSWYKVKPIPEENNWFENVWKDYNSGSIYN